MSERNILLEADELVNGERQRDYGAPQDNFLRWSQLCASAGIRVTAKDLAMIMVLGKIAREANSHKRDNLVDACGYLEIYGRLV